MKQKWIPLKKKLPYIYEYLLGNKTAKEINKELYAKHLTTSKNYSGQKCNGGLAIYLWTYCFLFLDYNMKNVSYTKSMLETLEEKIKRLEKENEKLRKQNSELKDVVNISKELLKEYIKKPDKDKIKKAIANANTHISIKKIMIYFGIARSTFYYKNVVKSVNERWILVKRITNILFAVCKHFKTLGRDKILPILNAVCTKLNVPIFTAWENKKAREYYDIKANIVHKRKRHQDPKNTKCSYPNLVNGFWRSDSLGKILYTDVTYFYDGSEWMYISTVIDGYDFRPIGWAISRNNDAELIMNSLKSIKINIDGAIIHSDHGAVYSSKQYEEYCKIHNLKISMSGIGKSLENYPIEHHWTFLKTMCLWHIPYENRTLANVRKELNNFYSWFANFFKFDTNNENSINYLYNQINKSCPTFYA